MGLIDILLYIFVPLGLIFLIVIGVIFGGIMKVFKSILDDINDRDDI